MATRRSGGSRYFNALEDFDLIARFDVVVVLDPDPALGARTDFVHIILEAAQRFEFAFINNDVVTQDANRTAALDDTGRDDAPGDRPELRRTEYVAHFRHPDNGLADFRSEQIRDHTAHVIDDIVDHAVVA